MGILRKLFGGGKPKPGSPEARRRSDEILLEMQGVRWRAKYSGGHPVCPKCGFRFPMTKEQIDNEGGVSMTICPKCQISMGL